MRLRGEAHYCWLVRFRGWSVFLSARDLLEEAGIEWEGFRSPVEQYLALSGRTLFKGLVYDDLVRLHLDIETTGLEPLAPDAAVLLVTIGSNRGHEEAIGAAGEGEAAILARLNLNGQGISGAGMNAALGVRLDAGKLKDALTPESKVAMTFPGGTHDLWLRYWLAAGGINPAKDLKTITVPPPEMVANVKTGAMEAFCVGEPWNGQLVNQRAGFTAAITGELWKDHPEKALAMRADWVQAHPRAAEALTAAVIEAQRWCDEAANKEELCSIVSREAWFNVPVADILPRLRGEVNYGDGRSATNPDLAMKFWRDHASYPFRSHDLWFLAENVRWGHLPAGADLKAMVEQVNREAVWRAAAERAGVKAAETPRGTSRGTETFFDGKTFDPENPSAYLASQPIKNAA